MNISVFKGTALLWLGKYCELFLEILLNTVQGILANLMGDGTYCMCIKVYFKYACPANQWDKKSCM